MLECNIDVVQYNVNINSNATFALHSERSLAEGFEEVMLSRATPTLVIERFCGFTVVFHKHDQLLVR